MYLRTMKTGLVAFCPGFLLGYNTVRQTPIK